MRWVVRMVEILPSRMMRCLGLVARRSAVGLFLLLAVGAEANDRSRALHARGLVPFDRGQWGEAMNWFEQAVRADRKDAAALHYRGLTHFRTGNVPAAVRDLEEASALPGAPGRIELDLGVALLEAGRPGDARQVLERAQRQEVESGAVAFFLGLACLRSGDRPAADGVWEEIRSDPEWGGAVAYYGALADLEAGRDSEAQGKLRRVERNLPESPMAREANRYLSTGGRSWWGGDAGSRRWQARGMVALEYDSNVTIGPRETEFATPARISGEGDARMVVGAGAMLSLLEGDYGTLEGFYDLSQSVHLELREFDLQAHRLGLTWSRGWKRIRYGAALGYHLFLLDYRGFYQEVAGTPWLAWDWSEGATLQGFYSVRGRDFLRAPFDPGRDGLNHALGLRQHLSPWESSVRLSFGYQFDVEDPASPGPQGRAFALTGHQLDATGEVVVFGDVRLEAGYLLRLDRYDNLESGFGMRRRSDNSHHLFLGVVHPLAEWLSLTGGYVATFHDSNWRMFQYERHIVSLGLQATF